METDAVSPRDHLNLFAAADRTTRTNDSQNSPGHEVKTTQGLATETDPKVRTPEEQQEIESLQARDREVRAHEQAHKATAGKFARGGATFEYETGPDGRRYASGGEVSIDTSVIPDDPEATIQKMRTIQRAALAPSDPSSQDQKVATEAAQKAAEAQAEILSDREESERGSLIDITA